MPFKIIRSDITKVKADAIVYTANTEVRIGDGVDARFIFHESVPVWIDGNHHEADLLRQSYDKCLELALQYGCESIAFPLLASGTYGFPKDVSLRIAIDAFRAFLSEHELEILLVLYDAKSVKLSETMFDGVKSFVDEKYTDMNARTTMPVPTGLPAPSVMSVPSGMQPPSGSPATSAMSVPTGRLSPTVRSAPSGAPVPSAMTTPSAMQPPSGVPTPTCYNAGYSLSDAGASFNSDKTVSSKNKKEEKREGKSRKPLFSGFKLGSSSKVDSAPTNSLDTYVDKFEHQEILSFGEYLQQLINKKGLTNKDVYFEANLTKQYFSKIINNKLSLPAKEKLLCIAVALKLNIDETNDFLLHAGYAISPYSKIDLVFEYYIRAGKFDVYEISFALEELGIEGGLWPELA